MNLPLSTYVVASYHPFAILFNINEEEQESRTMRSGSSLECPHKTSLYSRKIRPSAAYHWHPEKRELTVASERLAQFIKDCPVLLGSVQSLRLEVSFAHQMDLPDQLECFQSLSSLTLIGPLQSLDSLAPIADKLEKLVCMNTRLAPECIKGFCQFEKLNSLVLLGHAFINPRRNIALRFPLLASLKHMHVASPNAWLLHSCGSKQLPQLEALSLERKHISDLDLVSIASLENLKSLTLKVSQPIIVTPIMPMQHKGLKDLSLCFEGFATKDDGAHFLRYFPSLETLNLQGNKAKVNFYAPALEPLKDLKHLRLHNIQLRGLDVERHILQAQGIQLEYGQGLQPLHLHSRL